MDGWAHEPADRVRPFPDVTVQLLDGRPGLFLRNLGPEVVTVFGADDEPFAAVGPRRRGQPLQFALAGDAQARGESVEGLPPPTPTPNWRGWRSVPTRHWAWSTSGALPGRCPFRKRSSPRHERPVLEWSVPIEARRRRASS